MAEYEKMGWGCTLEWASSARSAAVSNTKNRMKQNPTFSYDRNTDLHQLLDFQKKEKSNADYREYWNAKMDCATEWRHIWEDRSGAKSELGMDGWLQSEEVGGWHLSCTQLLQTTGVPLSALHLDSLCLVRDTHWNYSVRRTAFKRMKFLPYVVTTAVLQTHSRLFDLTSICKKHYWRGQHFKVIHIV